MQMFFLLIRQNIIMLCYLAAGFILYKKNILTKNGSGDMGKLLLYLIMPSAIINSYMRQYSREMLEGFLISFAAALGTLILSMVLSAVIFRSMSSVRQFGAAFSNAGFIGIPLVQATIGEEAVFYVASFVALLNIFQWTYGVFIMTRDKNTISLKKILTNPIVLSLVIGLALFFFSVPLPDEITGIVKTLSSMNGPLAMIVLGTYLAQIPLRELFTDRQSYLCVLSRLALIPCLTILALSLIPSSYGIIRLSVLLAAAAPVGSNVAIFAQLYGKNYTDAVKDVCLSTFLSIFIMPCIVGIAGFVW